MIAGWLDEGRLEKGSAIPPETMLSETLNISRGSVRAGLEAMERSGAIVKRRHRRYVAEESERKNGLLGDTVLILGVTSENPLSFKGSGFLDAIQAGALEEASAAGMNAMSVHMEKASPAFVRGLIPLEPRGALAFRRYMQTEEGGQALGELEKRGVPLVVDSECESLKNAGMVLHDHRKGVLLLARALAARGAKRPLFMMKGGTQAWERRKEKGYFQAAEELGFKPRSLTLPLAPFEMSDKRYDEGKFMELARLTAGCLIDFFKDEEEAPDAVLAPTDWDLPVVFKALRLLGRRPGEGLQVSGYDNKPGSSPWLRFEKAEAQFTIDKRNTEAGRLMLRTLLEWTDGGARSAPPVTLTEPELVEKGGES